MGLNTIPDLLQILAQPVITKTNTGILLSIGFGTLDKRLLVEQTVRNLAESGLL